MRCEYKDGLSIDYSGSLHITKGDEINVFMEEGYIPANIRHDLDEASRKNSCEDFRKVGQLVTDTVGWKACLADIDSKACANF